MCYLHQCRQLQDERDSRVSQVARHKSRRGQARPQYWQAHEIPPQLWLSVSNVVHCRNAEAVIAPPSLFLLPVKQHVNSSVAVAAQNGYYEKFGAFTGEISYATLPSEDESTIPANPVLGHRFHQLADVKIPWVILGHSERRALFHESSDEVGKKTAAALKEGLSVIAFVGETLEQREADKTMDVVKEQLEGIKAHISDWRCGDHGKSDGNALSS